MKKSFFFYKELTPAEVGKTGTHEIYVRLPNNFDYDNFFGNSAVDNGTVMEVKFTAIDITNNVNESIPLRFVFFKESNREKRIPSLGPLFKSRNVQDGDIVCLESRIEGNNISYFIRFYKKGEIQINPTSIYFSHIECEEIKETQKTHVNLSLQQIFYGAPGTGKSYKINRETEDEDVIRTTFHPDTDYSSFVGAYKPTTVNERVMTTIGTKAVPVDNEDGTPRYESKIIYEFVCQSFLQAYVKAWEKYAEAGQGEPKKQFLVIEEINRGNCAQIFGDLFQLLDRNDKGFSDYPITADADMKKQLKKLLGNLTIEDKESINKYYKGRDVVSEVLNGDILLLPNNLYIWATMNTSDQSLFPIDSAFKRRWNWQYIPISNRQEGYKIEVNGSYYDWWEFLLAINDEIWSINHSEDKKLGYFFAKADGNNVINSDLFVGKVIFYLWNDVFKDFIEESGDIFKDEDGTPLSFDKFYVTSLSGDTKVVEKKAERFLKNLKLEPIPSNIDEDASNDFKVTYNGLVYKEGNATDTFIKVLEAIGLESLVDKEFDNCIVVTKGDKAKSRVFRQIGDYFIYIGLWSKYKKRWMKVMAESMNLDLQIEE